MKEHIRTEEQQKDLIFDIFSECKNAICPDTQKYYFQLWEQVYRWCMNYPQKDKKNLNNLGLEIEKVIKRLINNENISKIPSDKDSFFKYLNTSIFRGKAGSYREYNEEDTIKIPKDKKRKLRDIKDFIRMKESQFGRELTNNERIQGISKWFYISERKAIEYLDLINNINVGSLDVKNSNGEENNILDSKDLKPPYLSSSYEEPESAFFNNFNVSIINEAVKFVLEKKQERARDCYKALFTLYCVKNDLRGLNPILDQEIIDSFYKEDKKPKQYEIYLKYHPEIEQKSAEAMASTNLREFLKDIETYIKAKNQ